MKPSSFILVAALVLSILIGGYALRMVDEPPPPAPAPAPAVATPAPAAAPVVADTPVETPAPPVEATPPPPLEDGVKRIDLTGNASFFALFDELGIDDVEGRLAKWGLTRGYPQLDERGNPMLDQPYEQYDNETLQAFAESDDMWAQQFLAERLAKTEPAQAIEWYRKAAVNGSVHAMTEMARLYRDLEFAKKGTPLGDKANGIVEQQGGPESMAVTGYAWAAAAEQAGWDPLRGGMTASFVGAKLSAKQKEEACEYASTLLGGLSSARSERGLGEYDLRPPPVVFDPGTVGGTGCGGDDTPRYETECREVEVNVNGQISRLWTCDEGP
ncbi:MAG: hypothetical protein AB8G17_21970 [Gammaproteobacteria bacterium]